MDLFCDFDVTMTLLEKCAVSGGPKVTIGDGLSDRCAVHGADRRFAKKKLHDDCLEKGIPHQSFATLTEAAESRFPDLLSR
ncbi:MAG TPA: hypothetical protein VFA47_10825 [Candidatus Manganitrophaceae bacterium]|nr:hypothetical protein [Candidatus Manganitrophaceae bacterium]